ncbi:MAG: hypothetical protein K0R82_2819 [Flavipsychrobacter sp.]|nr:hypothetical protein [Flavipsychrobacter sp.]
MKFAITILSLICLISGYNPAGAQTLDQNADVLVLIDARIDDMGVQQKGKVSVVDGGLKFKCGYERSIEEARTKARKLGANIINIHEIKAPDAWSTCYRMWGNAYYTSDLKAFQEAYGRFADSLIATIVPPTAPYVMLFVYRPNGGATAVTYKLQGNDKRLCSIKNNSKYNVKLVDQGKMTLRTSPSTNEVTIDVKHGEAYFLKCDARGAFSDGTILRLMNRHQGLSEFGQIDLSVDRK